MSEEFLKTVRSRRVVRVMGNKPVERQKLEKVLEAARWAPAAGNQRTNYFVVVQDPGTLRLVRMFSPGMFQYPQALILICTDTDVVKQNQFSETDTAPYIDLGASMQTIMLAAHALGLGTGPVTSFSKAAIRVILNLPPNLVPQIEICVGYKAAPSQSQLPMKKKKRTTWQDLTFWEKFAS